MSKDELHLENELIENEFRELEKEFGLKISQLEQAFATGISGKLAQFVTNNRFK